VISVAYFAEIVPKSFQILIAKVSMLSCSNQLATLRETTADSQQGLARLRLTDTSL
jgi:hypothetical protein